MRHPRRHASSLLALAAAGLLGLGGTPASGQIAGTPPLGVPFGGEEVVPIVEQPDWNQQPVFQTTFTGPSGDFLSRSNDTDGVSVAVGGRQVFVASQERGEVTFHDAATRAFIRRVLVPEARAVAHYRGEVYVLGTDGGAAVVKVFRASDGALRRVLSPPAGMLQAPVINGMRGIAVAWNEVWISFVGTVAGGGVVVLDAQTGAPKGVMAQGPRRACAQVPTELVNRPTDCIEAAGVSSHDNYGMSPSGRHRTDVDRRWWDISAVPELNGLLVGCGFLSRDLLQQAIQVAGTVERDVRYGSECAFAHQSPRYRTAESNEKETWSTVGWMNGTDAVWGMNWYLVTDSSSPDPYKDGISVSEYDVYQGGLDVNISHRRSWTTRHGKNGDFDIAYQNREPRIDWSGPLTRSEWLRGTQCLSYIVSDADIFVVGNHGEHWYELARGFQRIELYVDGVQRGAAQTSPSGQFCFDTNSVASGRHTLKLRAYVGGGSTTVEATNDEASFDHTPPNGTLDSLPEATDATVAASGQAADAHSGPQSSTLQYRRTRDASGNPISDGWHDACTGIGGTPAGRWACTWDTAPRAEGMYQLQAALADSVAAQNGGANTAAATPSGNTTIAVDRTPPSLTQVSGQFHDHRHGTPIYEEDRPPLHVEARDALSGVRTIRVLVGEREIAAVNRGCPGGGCSLALDATFDPTQFEEGVHTVRVEAADALGRTAATTWQVEVRRSLPDTADESTADELDDSEDLDVDDGPEGPDTPRDNAGVVGGSSAFAPQCDSDDVVLWSHIDWGPGPAGELPLGAPVGTSNPSTAIANFVLGSAFLPKIPISDFQPVLVASSQAIYAISRDGARRAVIRAVETGPGVWVSDYFGGCSSLLSSYPGGIAG